MEQVRWHDIYQGIEMFPDRCRDRYGHRCVSIVFIYVIHETCMYEIDVDIDIDVPMMDGWLNGWMVYVYRYIRPQYHQPTIANLCYIDSNNQRCCPH